ncbi:cytochrome P450 [Curtobacterium aurantiacum]|uniref:Cytochrome P450 n=1 Tax=Curtobacterium aurantiacum TaxID=3236919 RepID=A0ABS5VIY0_9MICO|nr:cytochrome P450 [Curtobacterium flaccumfaciens]MBT1546874.1 cytochrome P450 [Curtobacterium flaccumfaciens pv. flaccumfaciens]MBT1589450.1 cytochrome P450 [Curtobacterium flaccumfaciens pv. flaccumfaciens]
MALDDSLSLLTRGYGFGAHLWRRTRPGARAVGFRLLGRPALLVRGAEGVGLFYDGDRTARHGAMPAIVQRTLFGVGSVHSLDGPEHHHRKATFVDVAYEDEQVRRLAPLLTAEWAAERDSWIAGGTRSAYDAAVGAIGRAVMRWAGLPGTPAAKTRWAARLAQVVDGFGVPYSPEYLQAVLNRHWSDRHARRLVEAVRGGRLMPEPHSALHEWAWHRDRSGALLPARLAGIELQNSIRPAIAVARFVAFAAKELHDRPEWRARIAAESAAAADIDDGPRVDGQHVDGPRVDGPLAVAFAQEIRRTAPFVPMLPAWATTDVELDGERLPAGGRVVLDITGTDTDERSWDRAGEFDPSRFLGVDDFEAITTFVPHGGAEVATGHRCPGEKVAIAALAAAVSVLSDPRVTILDDGLQVDRRRLPTKPASGGKVRGRCPFH